MDLSLPPGSAVELPAALLQATATAGLAMLFWAAYYRLPRSYLRWWGLTWTLYTVRMGAILAFFLTGRAGWLFWHQVLTGWTAICLLGAALAFRQPSRPLRFLWPLASFPVVWSYLAIYRLDEFLLAAGPAVAFLSLATLGAAGAFWRHHRRVASPAALFLATTLALWALHHLDYPFLRARGAWAPWGYYLDILFQVGTGFGILMLVLDDHRLGLDTLSRLSARILEPAEGEGFVRTLLADLRLIPGVSGLALVRRVGSDTTAVDGIGDLADWVPGEARGGPVAAGFESGGPVPRPLRVADSKTGRELLWIPVQSPDGFQGDLVVAGHGRHGLIALGDDHLMAAGRQLGIALDKAELTERLLKRTSELEELAVVAVGRHEAERKRISRELHDETAQALAAVRMRLAVLEEELGPTAAPSLAGANDALKDAIASIRRVAGRLRPVVLDELGLVPALRALSRDYASNSGVEVVFESSGEPRELTDEHELTLFRSLQEGLANSIRHSAASRILVRLESGHTGIALVVEDDGGTLDPGAAAAPAPEFGTGLIGMRERVSQLGGNVAFESRPEGGRLAVAFPLSLPEA
ncbi:MAG: sensor histidine kinase [Longimicrobiales bacterium]